MTETNEHAVAIRRGSMVASVVFFAAAIWISYAIERAFRRWLKEDDLLADLRLRIDRLNTGYQDKRDLTMDVAQVVGELIGAMRPR